MKAFILVVVMVLLSVLASVAPVLSSDKSEDCTQSAVAVQQFLQQRKGGNVMVEVHSRYHRIPNKCYIDVSYKN